MHKITNRTNGPFELQAASGERVFLPAMGEVEAEFDPDYLHLLALGGNVLIESAEKPKAPKRRGRPPKNKEPEHG